MKAFADDDMDFGGDDEEVKDFGGGGMVMTGKVSIDRDSGQVTGWDTIWSLIREENEKKPGDDQKDAAKKKVQDGVNKFIENNKNSVPSAAGTPADE